MCDPGKRTVRADVLLLFGLLFWCHERQPFFEGDGEGDEQVAGVVLVDPCLDLR